MGGGGSRYRADEPLDMSQMIGVCSWLATKESKIILKADGFETKTALGKGKFGRVFLSEHKKSSKYVAIKYIPIDQIYAGKHAVRIDQELQILSILDHPFIIHYFGCFKTPSAIALVFKYSLGGELFTRIRQKHKMEEEEIKFYGCEIALAVHYLHDTMNIVYRDLKPENILLEGNGHVTICDFGFACLLSSFSQLSDGCGTTMYLAPEIASGYKDSKHGFAVDWWSLGCLLYEMATGSAPFGDTDELNKFEVLNNINGKTVMYPLLMSRSLKKLISGLLQRDPKRRSKWDQFHESDWCSEVNWDSVLQCKVKPPWTPPPSNTPSTSNFLAWSDIEVPVIPASKEGIKYAADHIKTDNKPSLTPTPPQPMMNKMGSRALSKINITIPEDKNNSDKKRKSPSNANKPGRTSI